MGNTRLSHSATQQNTRAVGSTKNYNRASEGIIDPATPPVKKSWSHGIKALVFVLSYIFFKSYGVSVQLFKASIKDKYHKEEQKNQPLI